MPEQPVECRPGCKPGGACRWVGCPNIERPRAQTCDHVECCRYFLCAHPRCCGYAVMRYSPGGQS